MRRIALLALAGAAFAAVLGFVGYSVARDTIALPAVALEGGEPLAPAATRRDARTTTRRTTTTSTRTRSTRTRAATTAARPATTTFEDARTEEDDDGDSSGRGRGRNRGRGGDDD